MQLKSQLTSHRMFDELATAGVVADASAVNRVVIDARRGSPVVVHVEMVADTGTLQVIRSSALLDGLDLGAGDDQP
jgi:metal-dependent HD superfamily phosphatase/phosphodiesterase